MDNFIKKIFEDKTDELVHNQFQKYSKGEFKDKAVIMARKVKDKFSISTTPEFTNEFVRMLAEKLGDKSAHIKGPIISTRDLESELDYQDKKQFMGVKQYILDKEMSGNEIIDILDKLPLSHFGLSFGIDDTELKIKPKAPKSAKPSTKAEQKPKADFCKLITRDKELAKKILFDIDLEKMKKVEISHDFIITDLELPKEEKDFAKLRQMAKRKGKVVRKITIDDKTEAREANFVA